MAKNKANVYYYIMQRTYGVTHLFKTVDRDEVYKYSKDQGWVLSEYGHTVIFEYYMGGQDDIIRVDESEVEDIIKEYFTD